MGEGAVKAFLSRGYNVVATSRNIRKSRAFEASEKLALVDGNIADPLTAGKIAEVAKGIRVDRRAGQQRRDIFLETIHGLHDLRSAVPRNRQHRRLFLSASSQSNRLARPRASGSRHRVRRSRERDRNAVGLRPAGQQGTCNDADGVRAGRGNVTPGISPTDGR